jgi:leader peptidase (prepilin peptidase) / N-methyltransferase
MLTIVWAGLLGLSAGSFANVFLYRYPRGESLWSPPSRCPRCGRPVRWRHNVPLLSWLRLKGRCFDCRAPISASYPLVEAGFGALGVAVVWRFGGGARTWAYLFFLWALLLSALSDWRTQYIYDVITVPLLVLGLGMSFAFPSLLGGPWQSPLAALGMAATMLALQFLGRWMFGRDALGGGDVKLMAAAACFLGWPQAWLALLVASLLGLPLLLLSRAIRGGRWRDPVPFGPALALGCAVAAWDLLGGASLLRTWLGFGPA